MEKAKRQKKIFSFVSILFVLMASSGDCVNLRRIFPTLSTKESSSDDVGFFWILLSLIVGWLDGLTAPENTTMTTTARISEKSENTETSEKKHITTK